MTSTPRRAGLGVVSLVLAASLVACGGDDAPADDAASASATPTSADPSPTASDPASESASASASESATASVAPATGERVSGKSFSFVVPEGFTAGGSASGGLAGGNTFSDLTTTFCFISAEEIANLADTLDQEGAAQLQLTGSPGLTRLPDREVGGEQVFAFTGEDDNGTEYLYGRLAGDQVATLSFTFAPELVTGRPRDPAADQALVESVLATVEWTA